MDLALNNLQWLLCYNTKPNQMKSIYIDNILKSHFQICVFFELTPPPDESGILPPILSFS